MKRLVLAGAGHAHAQVLLDWARAPLPGIDLVLVSPQPLAPYSGMVPGWLSGAYRFDQIVIDFAALCRAAGARWVQDELVALQPAEHTLLLASGQTLHYDLLSLNLGSTLTPPTEPGTPVLSMRPLSHLQAAYEALLGQWVASSESGPYTVTAVGGGAAGFESLLGVMARLRQLRPDRVVQGRLVTRGAQLLPGMSGAARRAAGQALQRAGATLLANTAWSSSLAQGSDLALWATGAQAHAWQIDPLRRGGLAVGAGGFVRIDPQLRSVSHPTVFAVGDCAEWATPLPKAGVFAVRMGPVLAHNLRAALGQGALQAYQPQRRFLALLSTADARAIATWGPLGAEGAWAWRWKDHIDRRFLNRFAMGQPAGQPR